MFYGAFFSPKRAKGQLPIADRCAQELEKITKKPHWTQVKVEYVGDYYSGSVQVVEGFPKEIQGCADGAIYNSSVSDNLERGQVCAASLTRITGKQHEVFRTQFNWIRRNFYTVMSITVVENQKTASSN